MRSLMLLGVGLLGCSGEPGEVGPAPQDWSWEVSPERSSRVHKTISLELGMPAQARIHQGEVAAIPQGRGLRITGRRPVLHLPDPLDGKAFNQVAIRLRSSGRAGVQVRMVAGGETLSASKVFTLKASQDLQPLLISVPKSERFGAEKHQLRIHLRDAEKGVEIKDIVLLDTPRVGLLPPLEHPSYVEVQGQARPAVGVGVGATMRAQLEVGRNSTLEFSHAVPTSVFQAGEQLTLVLTVSGADGVVEQRLPLTSAGLDAAWTYQSLSLERFPDQVVDCKLELDGSHGAACAISVPHVVPHQDARTVLLITSDTHRADYLGLTSGSGVRTPFLDSLATGGTYFEDCWTSTNVTNPSHITLMTGLALRDTRVVDNETALSSQAVTLAERFSDAGFATLASVSAGHMRPAQSGLAQGFDRFSAPAEAQRDSVETLALLRGWLDEVPGRDIFVWFHAFDVHGPYKPPEEYIAMYYPESRDEADRDLPEPAQFQKLKWRPEVRDMAWVRASYMGRGHLSRSTAPEVVHSRPDAERPGGLHR